MSELLTITGLTKMYASKAALENVELHLQPGRIYGLLGPNGSGKTTLIKIINGLLVPNQGEVLINGVKPGPESKAMVSYLPDKMYFNNWMKVRDLVAYYGDFYEDFDETRAYDLLARLFIDPDQKMKTLSKGNKEKVQLILVMSRRARLYVLDEPIGGVDPAARDYILETILNNYDPSASILISTHLIRDIETVLTDAIFLMNGHVVLAESVSDIRTHEGKTVDEFFREVFRC